jgi:hypothetical protein
LVAWRLPAHIRRSIEETRVADTHGFAAIAVNNDTVTVRRSTGNDFGDNENWTHGPYFGVRGTFLPMSPATVGPARSS